MGGRRLSGRTHEDLLAARRVGRVANLFAHLAWLGGADQPGAHAGAARNAIRVWFGRDDADLAETEHALREALVERDVIDGPQIDLVDGSREYAALDQQP